MFNNECLNQVADEAYQNLKRLQTPNGLFTASANHVTTGYDKAWFRDCIYEAMGMEAMGDIQSVLLTYSALFEILFKHKEKIVWATNNKPVEHWQYIHARYHPVTLDEFFENWGNMQNDMVGLFLLKVADLEAKDIHVIQTAKHLEMIQILVKYLSNIRYYEDADNGMWEENREIHSSSVGNCVAGLTHIQNLVDVPQNLIQYGQNTLDSLLPNESESKDCDLAQLSLIWPCKIVSETQKQQILYNIETQLLRTKGVIRYKGDYYYNSNSVDNYVGGEAAWAFGLSWLALIYYDDKPKYNHYLNLALATRIDKQTPELFLTDGIPNENIPLGWAEAMLILAIKNL